MFECTMNIKVAELQIQTVEENKTKLSHMLDLEKLEKGGGCFEHLKMQYYRCIKGGATFLSCIYLLYMCTRI